MKFSEGLQDLATELSLDYEDIASNDLVTLADLKGWLNSACRIAWDAHDWTFKTLTRKFTIGDGVGETPKAEYYDYPLDFEDESISRLTIGGKPFLTRLEFEDYERKLDDDPNTTERIWSETERFLFVNENAYSEGDEVNVTGRRRFTKLEDDDDLLPFSFGEDDYENSGNDAIVKLAKSIALGTRKYNDAKGATAEREAAMRTLDGLWKPIAQRRAQRVPYDRPMFKSRNFFGRSHKSIDQY